MTADIKRYKTIHHTNHKDFDEAVMKSLQSGWQPFGNPYIVSDLTGPVICQAMVSTEGATGSTQVK